MFPTLVIVVLLALLYIAVESFLKNSKKDSVLKKIKDVEFDSEVVDLKQQLNKAEKNLQKKKDKL